MIYDKIENISRYMALSDGLAEGLRFLQLAAAGKPAGHYLLSGENYANIDEYDTKRTNSAGFEAHRKYIDIQYLLSGEERVLVRPLEGACCVVPYDAARDAAFFCHDEAGSAELRLGNGHFVILFPNDAHEPQLCIEEPQHVRKVVVKVAAV